MMYENYSYAGENYRFTPPIDTGEHEVKDIGDLVAAANTGPDATPIQFSAARLYALIRLRHSEAPTTLDILSSLLDGKHEVTLQQP